MEPPPDCSPFYLKSDDFSSTISHSSLKNDQNAKARDNGDFLDLSAKTGHFGSTKAGVLQPSARKLLSKVDRTSSVRSSAVIAYSATKNNAMFSHLAPDTNLNLAPSNWLRKTVGLRPETVLPGSRYSGNPNRSFSGFTMASGHLDSIGKVDIVSDAENIKKLLKMPYNKAHVSMAIHRIGRTLLLENFDIKRFTAEESEWEWFRNFYQELVQQQQGSNTLFNKKKSPSSQYDRLMLSKFLYYSIYKESLNKIENKSQEDKSFPGTENDFHKNKDSNESNVKLIELDEAFAKESMTSVENEDKIKELSSSLSSCASSTIPDDKSDQSNDEETKGNNSIIPSDRRWRYWTPHDSIPTPDSTDAFERNISWTFEDLQMLLGTNMPIFGGGRYPAVSLRLRDSNKPINILTGIDYWLDNLICNVPELVMCFHVNGIVQNYEVIKTEDIPKLEHSSFSPQVVKDIAQNILSFLKSNCTKEGHTYWLFKGSGDDVVKLYDLTTLCHTTTSDIEANRRNLQKNPYIFSVAMLLYKTAISLMQSRDTCDHRITVKKLLIQCIDLLDRTKYQYVVSSAICMLSTLYLPDPNLDRPAKEGTTTKEQDTSSPGTTGSSDLKACDTCSAHHDADVADKRKNSEGPRNAEVASIPRVTDLSIPERYQPISASFDLIKSPQSRARRRDNDEENGQVEESCNTVLSYVVSGMECLVPCYRLEWQQSLLCQLIRNAALAYFRLAEQASNLGKLGRALRRSKLALQSYETFDYLSGDIWSPNSNNTERRPPDFHLLLPRMLSLCGEIQFALVQDIKSHGAVSLSHREELTSFTEDDEKIKTGLTTVLSADGKFSHLTQMSSEIDQALLNCSRCYEMALDVMEEFGPINKDGSMGDSNKNSSKSGKEGRSKGKGRSKRNIEPPSQAQPTPSPTPENEEYPTSPTQRQAELIWALRTVLTRRHGHVVNELGASSLNRVVTLLSNDSSVTVKGSANHKIWDAWNEAKTHFEAAHKSFAQVNDAVNEALVLSNMGRLMRVSAQFYANNEQGQLSQQERQCFTTAIEKYQKALSLLGPKDPKRGCPVRVDTGASTCTTVYDNISWELSSSYFNMAQILQENAPEERQASEEAEKEVISLMNNSLKYCKDIWDKTAKQSVALYRQSKIYYRMASLHHNAYRSCTDIHKCKQLRNLAEKQYAKSLAILEVLDEHPYEMLRVQLERMALKEQHISSLNSLSQKMKLLFEGLYAVLECMKPLQRIEKSTKLATEDSFSSQVDSREQSSNTELDPSNVSEILGLLRILATILQSFLLLIVKFMKITGYEHESSLIRRRNQPVKSSQQSFKELYSRTLRSLQRVNVSEDEESNIDGIEGKYLVLQENVTTMINVLKDVENVLGK